jgi:hypothetical protein
MVRTGRLRLCRMEDIQIAFTTAGDLYPVNGESEIAMRRTWLFHLACLEKSRDVTLHIA